jgi:MinD-like ATPase involved in chromosome partitioning or flagellar assembly
VDLPTYTNIWRIEKRLYKLYDLRLPMPLPLGQIAAFVGITVPYVLFLTLIGVPFSHNLFWLYVLPPGVLTWLVTRPVLENKKLPELLVSQVRYLGEPKIWCRMSPATEKDEIVVVGQVWHARLQPAAQAAAVEIRREAPVPARVSGEATASAPGQPAATALASDRQGPPVDLRHRNPAAWGPRPTVPAARRIATPDRRATAGFAPQRARAGAARAPDRHMVAPGSLARQRATAPARPQGRPVRPAASAPQRAQQPAWVTRARPDAPVGGPAETARRPRVIEVAHAEHAWPASSPADEALTPVPGVPPARGPGPGHAAPPVTGVAPAHRIAPGHAAPPPVPGVASAHRAAPGHAVPPVPEVASAHWAAPGHAPPPVPGPKPARAPWDPRVGAGERIAPYVPDPDRATQPGGSRPGTRPTSPGARPVSKAAPPSSEADTPGDRPSVSPTSVPPPRVPGTPGAAAGRGAGEREGADPSAPAVTVRTVGEERPAPPLERALSGPAGPRGRSWNDRVGLVPGGQGPGRSRETEREERYQARARLLLPGPRRIVVVGCTSGAGQTVTTLMLARLLASLRAERVGVLDLNPGSYSLTQRAETLPAGTVRDLLDGAASAGHPGPGGPVGATGRAHSGPGIEVISAEAAPASVTGLDEADFSRVGDHLVARYEISLVDPGASSVARVLGIADQLVLVAPASAEAPRAVSMTHEWLASHEHGALAANAILVVNGVSGRSMADVERAEAIAAGRCRAIVRVPWEDQLGADDGPCAGVVPLRLAPRRALTALAGVLVGGLAAGPATGPGEPR